WGGREVASRGSGRRDEQLLRGRRPQPVSSAGEVARGALRWWHMLDGSKAGLARERHHLGRREEADERRASLTCAALRSFGGGALVGVGELEREHERHDERRARGERCDLAKRRGDRVLREVHRHAGGRDDGGPRSIEAGTRELLPP